MPRHRTASAEPNAALGSSVMSTHTLDTIDLRILEALQSNGRATNIEIAEQAGISAPPTLRRTRTLEERGIIRGYHAVLDEHKLGYAVTAFLQVRLVSQSSKQLDAFETLVNKFAHVRECYSLSGQRDFLLKCVFRTLSEAQAFVTDVLLIADNIASVTSSFCVRAAKKLPDVPLALIDAPAPSPAARKLKLPR